MSKNLDLSKATLSAALDAGEFVLYFQPDFDPKTEEVSDLEAFIRWNHSIHGLCNAALFIAGFERNKELVNRLDQWVLHEAMTQGKRFLDNSNVVKAISVNLSNWLSGEALVANVSEALNTTGFPAEAISLECPWRMFVAHSADIVPVMHKLDKLGCKLIMDGSPLEQECLDIIKDTPVKTSKICFESLRAKAEELGVSTASSMIKNLRRHKLKVVVVGVENEVHAELARRTGCSLSQGNRFKSPLSSDQVLQLLSVIKTTKDAFKLL